MTTTTLPITGTLPNGLGLMYLDQATETLMEITPETMYLAVYPYEQTSRRFYLCGDILFTKCIISLTVDIDSVHTSDYTVKILAGQTSTPSISSFVNATNTVTTSYSLTNPIYSNAIPIDIFLVSNLRTESVAALSINIQASQMPAA